MLRTIALRSDLIKGTFRKNVIRTITRTLTVECVNRIPYNRKQLTLKHQLPQQWTYQIVRCYSDLPRHTKVTLPALSPTMEEGTIVSWAKKEGDKLNEGDLLAEIETDKATMAFETPEEGYLARILIPAGTKGIPIGKLVCIIVESESDVAAFKNFEDTGATVGKPAAAPAPAAPAPAPPVPQRTSPPPPSAAPVPEHTKVTLPALSPTMEEGQIVSWAKKEGDKLNEGDVLAEIETDKATMAFETPEEGFLAKILIPSGTKGIRVGKLVCIIVENERDISAFKDFKEGAEAAAPSGPPSSAPSSYAGPSVDQPVPLSAPAAAVPSTDRVYASPMAKRLAEQRQIRLQGKGSGMYGSITAKDIQAGIGIGQAAAAATHAPPPSAAVPPPPAAKPAAPRPPPGALYMDVPVTNIRGVIAKRLLMSKQTIPHYYLTAQCNVDKLLELRSQYNKKLEKDKIKISVNDFIIKAVAVANTKVPEANSAWMDSVIRVYKNVDVSVAVSTPTGLITPIIFEADRKGIIDISKEIKDLAAKARANKLQPHEFQGGTISVSNLGMFGVNNFSAIINPGQSCILAIGTTTQRLVEDPKSEKGFTTANYMSVTLSCDHRVVDGAEGAKWLQAFKQFIEDPVTMIM